MSAVKKTRNFPGLTNYVVPIPGTDVTAFLGVWDHSPLVWIYTLWTGNGTEDDTEEIATGEVNFGLGDKVNLYKTDPEVAAKIAFILNEK